MTDLSIDIKEAAAGGLMIALGVGAAYQAFQYDVGTVSEMGPGFFPLCLGSILAIIGAILLISALRVPVVQEATKIRIEWRGWICILVGLSSFAIIGQSAGILPATFATVFISALGDRQNSLSTVFLTAAFMTLICLVVFSWLLQVQLPLIHWG